MIINRKIRALGCLLLSTAITLSVPLDLDTCVKVKKETKKTSPITKISTISTNKDFLFKTAKASTKSSVDKKNSEEAKKLKADLKIKGFKFKKTIEKKVVLKWKKNKKAKGFNIYRSTKKKSGFKNIGSVKKAKFTDKKAKARKTYYYKIKAWGEVSGDKVLGKYSKTKKIYTYPKVPKTVIAGECFVVGMTYLPKSYFNKKTIILGKSGLNSLQLSTLNHFEYKGKTLTAAERAAYHKADRIYVLVGANEAKNGNPKAATANFNKMFKLLKKVNPHIQLVVMALPPFGVHSTQNIPTVSKRKEFIKEYMRYAKKTKNVYYCNSSDVMLNDGSDHLKSSCDGGDGCHWTTSGTAAVVSNMKKWSKKTLETW